MDEDDSETMAVAQVTQFTCKVDIGCKPRRKRPCLFYVEIFGHQGSNSGLAQNSQDTSTTVAGAVWVSAKRRRLWRSLSSAAFLAVALMCATVTCRKDRTRIQIRNA